MGQEITAAEFQDAVAKARFTYDGQVEEDWSELSWGFDPFEIEGVGTVFHVEKVGGGPGSGEEMEFTVKLRPSQDWLPERYFTMEGYYSSYDGSNWDDEGFYESTPKEELVVKYVRKRR